MRKYVLGFAFSKLKETVVLIKKTKPEWQAGNYNGVGGKIEEGETPIEAMVREYEEETSVKTANSDWHSFGKMSGTDWVVHLFHAEGDHICYDVKTTTEERVDHFGVHSLPKNLNSNIRWLVEFCLDRDVDEMTLDLHYEKHE